MLLKIDDVKIFVCLFWLGTATRVGFKHRQHAQLVELNFLFRKIMHNAYRAVRHALVIRDSPKQMKKSKQE